ncbi:MAG: hypothetical protein J0M24_08660 [Verrucomicrobia bacterium]|nr:hypothetical protein [Verrucomicrobiota bacterium]
MNLFLSRSLGFVLACLTTLASEYELVVHFGDPAEVVDRTPKDGRNYLGPGHPHAESFRFPLREFSIAPVRNLLLPGGASPTNGLHLIRVQDWMNPAPDFVPTPVGRERFNLLLLTAETNLFPAGTNLVIPQTFPLSGGSELSYDFFNQYYGGGGFMGIGQIFADVIAYDVKIVSFELVPVAEPTPPQLSASRLNDSLVLTWERDAFRGYQVEQSDSPLGPWTKSTGNESSNGGTQRHSVRIANGGFFRLVTRNQQ